MSAIKMQELDHVKITIPCRLHMCLKVTWILQITLFAFGSCGWFSQFIPFVLSRFDKRITEFAEEKFQRDGIDVKTGSMVVKVSDKEISTKERSSGKTVEIPFGMVVWSTGIGTRPVIMDFMKQIGQVWHAALILLFDFRTVRLIFRFGT